MYTRHPSSAALEMELGDFKLESRFRLLAFDQGRFAFADMDHHDDSVFSSVKRRHNRATTPGNTVVLVTSPKDPLFKALGEDESEVPDQIRVLVFSQDEIQEVSVTIDGIAESEIVLENRDISELKDGQRSPMYAAEWDPSPYSRGLHTLRVRVRLSSSSTVEKSQHFSLDGSHENFPWLASAVLLVEWVPFSQFAFVVAVAAMAAVMATVRVAHYARLR